MIGGMIDAHVCWYETHPKRTIMFDLAGPLRRSGRISYLFLCERLFPLSGPQFPRPFAVLAVELVGRPEHRAVDHGAIIAGQVHDPGFDHEAAEFDQMPGALAALDLPSAHVMPRPLCLTPVARRLVASERHQRCGQLPEQFAVAMLDRDGDLSSSRQGH